MEFSLTDEQQQLRRTVREFAEAEIAPHVMEWDEASHFPSELIPRLAEMGFLGVIFPEKYGGAGMGYLEYAIIIEELSRVDGSIGLTVAAHNSLCTNHIFKFGSEEQKQKYLVPLAQGKKLGCWSLTEPEAGSDAGGTRTVAVKQSGAWLLNGSKTFTTNGHYADVCVAMAVTDASKKHHGISAFVIEKGTPGFRPGKEENKLGMRASDTSEVVFTDCRIPAENLLGREGDFPGVAPASAREIWLSLSSDPNLVARIPSLSAPAAEKTGMAPKEILEERAERIGPSLSISYRKPLEIVRGSMQTLYDETGRPYLDCVNNVAHVGHSHPRAVPAGRRLGEGLLEPWQATFGRLAIRSAYRSPAVNEFGNRHRLRFAPNKRK